MSHIRIKLATDKDQNIDMDIKCECSPNELEVATASLMHALAKTDNGLERVKDLVTGLEEALTEQVKTE